MILNQKQLTNILRKTYSEKIIIRILKESGQDEDGFTTDEVWEDYLTCWCFKKASVGKEFINSNAENSEETISFTTRYCKKLRDIDEPGMSKRLQLFYKNRVWNIVNLDDYRELHIEYDITAKLIN